MMYMPTHPSLMRFDFTFWHIAVEATQRRAMCSPFQKWSCGIQTLKIVQKNQHCPINVLRNRPPLFHGIGSILRHLRLGAIHAEYKTSVEVLIHDPFTGETSTCCGCQAVDRPCLLSASESISIQICTHELGQNPFWTALQLRNYISHGIPNLELLNFAEARQESIEVSATRD